MGRVAERKFWDKAAETPLSQLRDRWICDKNVTDEQCLDAIYPYLKKGKTLDLGCGIGRLTQDYGTDISSNLLDLAHKGPHYRVCDGRSIPFINSFFSNVFSMGMFQHIPDEAVITYLSEVYRVLKSGGIFRFQFVNQGEEAPMSFVRLDVPMARWLQATGFELKTVESLIYPEWTWITAQKS